MRYFITILIFIALNAHAQVINYSAINPSRGNFAVIAPVTGSNYSFSFADTVTASAGVYDKNSGNLVRTLFSAKKYTPGLHTESWDMRKDDSSLANRDDYIIKVESSKASYTWEGTQIGNTANAYTGVSKYRTYEAARDVCFIGDTVYWAGGYQEAAPAQFLSSLSHPENGKAPWFEPTNLTNQTTTNTCTDGNYIYWLGQDLSYESYVFATVAATRQRAVFANGVSVQTPTGGIYPSVIAYRLTGTDTISVITGGAVQKTGNYLFVSRSTLNEIQVVNKNTGAEIRKISLGSAGLLSLPNDSTLWIAHGSVVEKYGVNSDGTLTTRGITVTAVGNIGGMDASPDGTAIAICDMDNQVVKGYSATVSNALLWTVGTVGGYITDATVTNNKFFWRDGTGFKRTFIKYTPDGGFYLGDGFDFRTLQFNNTRSFVRSISWPTAIYTMTADNVNPGRIFTEYLEFNIDYTKSLDNGTNGSWLLTKNWGGAVAPKIGRAANLLNITTLSNTKTYCFLQDTLNGSIYYVCELLQGGALRKSSNTVSWFSYLDKDGTLYKKVQTSTGNILTKQPLTGFDNSNNPVWGIEQPVFTTLSVIPRLNSIIVRPDRIIAYDISAVNQLNDTDYHVAAINLSDGLPIWKTARGTRRDYQGIFPNGDYFDNGNGVNLGLNGAGGFMTAVNDSSAVVNYHGEFWKASQTNMFNHYDTRTGLLIGQFGAVSRDNVAGMEAPPMIDGNTLKGSCVTASGKTYLYTNGESFGIHRWRIDGLNTINLQNAIFPAPDTAAIEPGINLLAGLIRNTVLADTINGWKRSLSEFYSSNTNLFSASIGSRSYNLFEQPDLYVKYRLPSVSSASITRNLQNTSASSSWKLYGNISLENNSLNEPTGKGGGYVEVLDNTGKAITRFYMARTAISTLGVIYGNDKIICSDDSATRSITLLTRYYQPFEFSTAEGTITFKYAGYSASTTSVAEAGANMNYPAQLRLYFFTNASTDNYDRIVSFNKLLFTKN